MLGLGEEQEPPFQRAVGERSRFARNARVSAKRSLFDRPEMDEHRAPFLTSAHYRNAR
jgi:hypothetical protein